MNQFLRLTDVLVSFRATDGDEGRTLEDSVSEVTSGNST